MTRERPAGGTTRSKRLERYLPGLIGFVVIAIAVGIAIVRQIDDRPRAEPGAVFLNPDTQNPLPNAGTVVFPWARLSVATAAPRDELPDGLRESTGVRAPEGGSFVRVQLTDLGTIAFAESSRPYLADVDVLLRANGADHTLSGPDGLDLDRAGLPDTRNDVWVAVEGHPQDLAVVVRIGGEEQVVDTSDGSADLGRAADLAALPSAEDQQAKGDSTFDCGSFVRTDDQRFAVRDAESGECRVADAQRTPYVGDLGWAEPGREFVVVTVLLPLRREFDIPAQSPTKVWHAMAVRTSATLGGQPDDATPVDTWARGTDDGGRFGTQATQFIFEVPRAKATGDLTVTTRYRARGHGPFAAKNLRADLAWTIAARKLA
ncbi:hypothetical protein [Nocardioides jensenii]|uniref:hypothetical protein n=1 Tax=Nocardioides jensenii TaxID=1843 RepID=UPI000834E9CB|nr:hypothetical protein [Nocardioides jensenii]